MSSHQDEEDTTAIVANIENKYDYFACRGPESPSIRVVVGPERQTCGEEEIGYGQVQDESVGEGSEILILCQDHNDQGVAHKTENHHKGIEHRGEDVSSL